MALGEEEVFDAEVIVATRVKNVLRREMDDWEVESIDGPSEGDDNTFSVTFKDGSVFMFDVVQLRGPRR